MTAAPAESPFAQLPHKSYLRAARAETIKILRRVQHKLTQLLDLGLGGRRIEPYAHGRGDAGDLPGWHRPSCRVIEAADDDGVRALVGSQQKRARGIDREVAWLLALRRLVPTYSSRAVRASTAKTTILSCPRLEP